MPGPGMLKDLRVVELADERGEFLGKLLAGSGADVVKVEPPGGSPTRHIGPHYEDRPGPDRSIYFWHYNLGKRSAILDLKTPEGADSLRQLLATADVLIDTNPPEFLESRGLGNDALRELNPKLIVVDISPFGRTDPYPGYKTSDLVHLALGGVMDLTGYPRSAYPAGASAELTDPGAPIAPQMWQSYHMVSTLAHMNLLAALLHRDATGRGQVIDMSIHESVVYSMEGFVQHWTFERHHRPRGHFTPLPFPVTKDGHYLQMGLIVFPREWGKVLAILNKHGMAEDLGDPKYEDAEYRQQADVVPHIRDVFARFMGTMTADELFHESQAMGIAWCPVKAPEDNLSDPHLSARGFWQPVEHPEIGRVFLYPRGMWDASATSWQLGPRAPMVGEHTDDVLRELAST